MQTVILAGGKGTRLRPLTYNLPKPMVPINGRPFLHHLLEYVSSFGLNDILLLVGYMADKIEEYFQEGSELGLTLNYSREEVPLGTGGALKNAGATLSDQFLLINGDTFLPLNYRELVGCFHGHKSLSTITVYSNPEKTMKNNIDVNESDLVIKYDKRDSKGLNYVDAGAIVLRKEVLDFIPEDKNCSLEEEIFQELISRNEMMAYITDQRYFDMGTMDGINALNEVLR